VADPAWLPARLAADDCLRLLARDPRRIRECVHENCILTFFDTSQNGRRRWCSMALCGNRAKAARHYAQQTEDTQQG
jgi:predicted RNA-binding Zn ribbon-like protein